MAHLLLSIPQQTLQLYLPGKVLTYLVSTGVKGVGEQQGSGCTPRGKHLVRAKIGEGLPANAVFVGRRFTGEIYSQALAERFPDRDWILSRILWLSGLEPGVNRLGNVDTMRRKPLDLSLIHI